MRKIENFDNFQANSLNERVLPDSQGQILVILGAPGSGKGTLAKELERKYNFVHISTGDLIRNSKDPELKKIIDGGNLVPDEMMVKILRRELKKVKPSSNIIFDGFPRTVKQSKRLDSMLGKMGLGLNHTIYLNLSDEKAKERIKSRAGKENRKDDTKDSIIENRFKEYREKTLPLVELDEKSRKLIKINAEHGRDEVLRRVVRKLSLKRKKS